MKINNLPSEFIKALPVIEAIEAAGYEAYFVGGSVRDIVLHHEIHDVDIATSAFPEEIKQIFQKTIDVGIEHGTVLVLFEDEQYEITTFRTESTYQDYRRPDQVTFVRSLEEDLKRRDFTMNALAMNKSGDIIDLFDGMRAIANKQIIAVGEASERFHEDALRMMRALRFASQLNFCIEEQTLNAIKEHHALLEKISIERIYIEWIKLLLGEHRENGLVPFIETRCFAYCPGLSPKETKLRLFSEVGLNQKIPSEAVAWIVLLHTLNISNGAQFLKRWKASNKMITEVADALSVLKIRETNKWTASLLYSAGEQTVINVELTLALLGQNNVLEETIRSYASLPIKHIKEMRVTGNDLLQASGKTPGPWLGRDLKKLELAVVERKVENKREELLTLFKEMHDEDN